MVTFYKGIAWALGVVAVTSAGPMLLWLLTFVWIGDGYNSQIVFDYFLNVRPYVLQAAGLMNLFVHVPTLVGIAVTVGAMWGVAGAVRFVFWVYHQFWGAS